VAPVTRVGYIRKLNGAEGFGFIADHLFRFSALADDLTVADLCVGLRVTFDSVDTARGMRAENVRIAAVQRNS